MESKLIQIHHKFEDGHTDFIAQREISSYNEMSDWVGGILETDPPPMCAQFLFCIEGSQHFLMMAENKGLTNK